MSEEIISTSVPATRWKNSTKQTVRFTLNIATAHWNDRRSKMIPPEVREVVIEPGQECVLPASYDPAIQRMRDGQCVSGLAPSLVKMVDGVASPAPIHPALTAAPVVDHRRNQEARLLARLAK